MDVNADDNVNPPHEEKPETKPKLETNTEPKTRLNRVQFTIVCLLGFVGAAQAGVTFASGGLLSFIGLAMLTMVTSVVFGLVGTAVMSLLHISVRNQTGVFLDWLLVGVAVVCTGWLWWPMRPAFIGNQYHDSGSILIAPPWTRVAYAHSLPKELRLEERGVVVRGHSVDITVIVPLAPDENNHVAISLLANAGMENKPYVEERMNSVGRAGAGLLTRVVQAVHSNAGFSLGKYGSVVGVDKNALSDRLQPVLSALPLKLGDGPIEVLVEPDPSGSFKAENSVLFIPLGQLL